MMHQILVSVSSDDLDKPYKNIRFYTMGGKALGHTTTVLMNMDTMKNFNAEIDVKVLLEDLKKEIVK